MRVDPVANWAPAVLDASAPASKPSSAAEAARQFEALLLRQMLESMPMSAFEGKEIGTFKEMMLESLAQQIVAGGGLGLAEQLEQALGSSGVAEEAPLGITVSSPYGRRLDPIDGSERFHEGVDLSAPHGTPIRSMGDGVVSFAGEAGGLGNLVVVDHGDGLQTRYAHCAELFVEVGDRVSTGGKIATVGATGRATGAHLHLEVRRDGVAEDPTPLLDPKADRDPIREAFQRTLSATEGRP